MIMNLYVINDDVAVQSSPVFEAKNDGMAQRQMLLFLEQAKKEFKDEFTLMCVGEINHDTNVIKPKGPYKVNSLYKVEPEKEIEE